MTNTEKVVPVRRQTFSGLINKFNDESVRVWNRHELESFCDGYADDATMVTSVGIFKGRKAILHAYEEAYPDRSRMGTISAEVVDIRFPPYGAFVSMATAIVRCTIILSKGVIEEGYSMVTFVLDHSGEVYIAQDTSN